ncbi:hypothetical protein [Umezawaea tangerina]|uniref:Uncharacterized protein n=1 Tax=Umezawaea tangerina TaxID=84725 RepID=A0A2T0T6K0_9PSEU|nr:hypothetical protein [Umezawaea tangerina]PRY41303.1 hypothetical protein CLV43_10561 [Umezawaea tangerina]
MRGDGEDQVTAITAARSCAVTALGTVFSRDITGLSERDLHDNWQAEIAKTPTVTPHGWYAPPPAGMSVLVGAPPDYRRANFTSLRDHAKWPRPDKFATRDSLLFVYCSPVDRRTAMLGDFQATLYGGDVAEVQDHITVALEVTLDAVAYAEVGMEYRELYDHAVAAMRRREVTNDTHSSTDRSGDTNIGHTVPWFGAEPEDAVRAALRDEDHLALAAAMSGARRFLTERQRARIGCDEAFTVEPQITSRRGVLASFHFIVVFTGGAKLVLAGLSPLFARFDMARYLPGELTAAVAEHDRQAQSGVPPSA